MSRMSTIAPWYRAWADWRAQGSQKGKRPASAPKKIPNWAWDRYKAEFLATKPTPSEAHLVPYRSIVFLAQDMTDALAAPAHYKIAVTADPAYGQYVRPEIAATLRAAGHEIYVWYVPTEVSRERAIEVGKQLGATRVIGQAESAHQYATSKEHGLKAVVGNITALLPEQIAEVAEAKMIMVNETYYNVQPWLKPDWRNANHGIAGNCLAVYASTTEGAEYTPLQGQPFVKRRDSVYGPGMRPEDWATL